MNIEELGKKAVDIIKNKWELPAKGLLAGGSIANIMWELVSGNKSVINDLDIFIKVGDIEIEKKSKGKQTKPQHRKKPIFEKQDFKRTYFEGYNGLGFSDELERSYYITEAKQEGIFNNIEYKSTTDDYSIVIKSFDINCTQVGYDIEDDKLIWTKDFEHFLKSGCLKITNLTTPAHTAIRIVKKKKDLNCFLDVEFELNMARHSISQGFIDKIRVRFKDKYKRMFNDNIDILSEYFIIKNDLEVQSYIKTQFYDNSEVYYLETKEVKKNFFNFEIIYKDDENIANIYNSSIFLFYMRNIYGSEKMSYIWQNLNWFFDSIDYIDSDNISKEDVELLGRLTKCAANTIEKLKGYKLSQQIKLVKRLLDEFKDDPLLAISILEKHRVDIDFEFNDEDKLLLELSVRKQIVSDDRNKVNRILNPDKKSKASDEEEFDLDLLL